MNDGCWQSALSSAGRRTRLQVAYDDQYVCLATRCASDQLAADVYDDTVQKSQPTIRDHDLSDVDRVRHRRDMIDQLCMVR